MNRNNENSKADQIKTGISDDLTLGIFDSLPVGVLLFERTAGVLLVNMKAGTYLNIDRDSLMRDGFDREDASPGEKYLAKIIESVLTLPGFYNRAGRHIFVFLISR